MHPNPRTPGRRTSSPGNKADFSAQLTALPRQSAMQRYLGEDSSTVPIANTLYGKYQAGTQGDIVHEPRCARGIEMGSTCKVPPQASGMPRFEAQSPSDGRFLATICPDHQLKPTKQAKSMSLSANDRSSSSMVERDPALQRWLPPNCHPPECPSGKATENPRTTTNANAAEVKGPGNGEDSVSTRC
ncbi:MAG: hypothetical protein LQ349_008572 [Xanthoria aureola]|nr:MAG: hypothetical protein LQ349_008572 [Xanthoria aureola]